MKKGKNFLNCLTDDEYKLLVGTASDRMQDELQTYLSNVSGWKIRESIILKSFI
jgi:hypothetical protein